MNLEPDWSYSEHHSPPIKRWTWCPESNKRCYGIYYRFCGGYHRVTAGLHVLDPREDKTLFQKHYHSEITAMKAVVRAGQYCRSNYMETLL